VNVIEVAGRLESAVAKDEVRSISLRVTIFLNEPTTRI
jgi:hypothetical protein